MTSQTVPLARADTSRALTRVKQIQWLTVSIEHPEMCSRQEMTR
jgi:hypothetical protein